MFSKQMYRIPTLYLCNQLSFPSVSFQTNVESSLHDDHQYFCNTTVFSGISYIFFDYYYLLILYNCDIALQCTNTVRPQQFKLYIYVPEDSYNFFFACSNCKLARSELLKSLIHFTQLLIINGETKHKMLIPTSIIFSSVQKIIRDSSRFTYT